MFDRLLKKLLHWRQYHNRDQLDWITRNRVLIQNHMKEFKDVALKNSKLPDRKKIMFWYSGVWERGGVEHMLVFSLWLRGHEVFGVRCSGGMPACSMESTLYPRPNCEDCIARSQRLLDIFDLYKSCFPIDDYISDEEKSYVDSLDFENMNYEDLISLEYKGVAVGKNNLRDLPQYFFRLVDADKEKDVLERYRISVKGGLLYTIGALNVIEKMKPDHAIVTSGKTIGYGSFFEVCKEVGVPVVTWDESVGGLDSFVFDTNRYAVEYRKGESWEKISGEPLQEYELNFVEYYFAKTSKGAFGRHNFYKKTITDESRIRADLGLDSEKPIMVILTNLTWDTSALGRDIGFDSMLDWIFETIDYVSKRTDLQLVVRTHPAEGHLDSYARGCESVSSLIKNRYPDMPNHVKVVTGKEEINSHKLCEISDIIAIYSTTVGLEMAMKGRKVMVCGDRDFRGKGFTIDIDTKEKYFQYLDSNELLKNKSLNESQIKLAKKFGYFFIVRAEAYLPEFHLEDRHSFEIFDARDFLPFKSKRWDLLCDSLLSEGQFVDCTDFIDPWEDFDYQKFKKSYVKT